VWSTPQSDVLENIHIEVTVTNNDDEPTTAFGVMCHQQDALDSYYYFAITPVGQYAIALSADGQDDVFLTNNDQWGESDLIEEDKDSYRIGADCGNGRLTLYVDGQRISSVTDSAYTSGIIGLFVWSGDDVSTADVTFDDFVVTALE